MFLLLFIFFLSIQSFYSLNIYIKQKKDLILYQNDIHKIYKNKSFIEEYTNLLKIYIKEKDSDVKQLIQNSINNKLCDLYKEIYKNDLSLTKSGSILLLGDSNISYIQFSKINRDGTSSLKKNGFNVYSKSLKKLILENSEIIKNFDSDKLNNNTKNIDKLEKSLDGSNFNKFYNEFTLNIYGENFEVTTLDYYNMSKLSVDSLIKPYEEMMIISNLKGNQDLRNRFYILNLFIILRTLFSIVIISIFYILLKQTLKTYKIIDIVKKNLI